MLWHLFPFFLADKYNLTTSGTTNRRRALQAAVKLFFLVFYFQIALAAA